MGCCQSNSDINIVKNEHGKIVMRSFDNKHDKSNGPRLKRHSTSTEDAVSANLDVTRFTIFISRIKGRNLVPKDVTTSDPYVVFKWDGGSEYKTAVKKYTLNPVWDDYFQFCFECNVSDLNGKILAIDVYDYNSLTTDQSIGYTNIPINTIATGPVHYDVALKSKKIRCLALQSPEFWMK